MIKYLTVLGAFAFFVPRICSTPYGFCNSYSCNQDKVDKVCLNAKSINSTWEFAFNSCPEGLTCQLAAEFMNQISTNSNTTLSCSQVPMEEPTVIKDLVDQQVCNDSSECKNGKCLASLCTGYPIGSFCLSHSECEIGSACSEIDGLGGVCQAQIDEGGKCSDDYQCKNNLGCENRLCVKYNSRMNGLATTNANFCISGATRILNNQIICDSISLVERNCTQTEDHCKYIWDSDQTTKEITGCSCDLNPQSPQARHCDSPAAGVNLATLSTAHTLLRFNVYPTVETIQPYSECINYIMTGSSVFFKDLIVYAAIATAFLLI